MKPYYEQDGITIYHGDCRDVLPSLPPIDCVVTSPPYNQLGSLPKKGSGLWGKTSGGAGFLHAWEGGKYEDAIPETEYQEIQNSIFSSISANASASLFYNHQLRWRDSVCIHPIQWFQPEGWRLRQEILWDRGGGMMFNARMFVRFDERILWFTKKTWKWNQECVGYSTIWRIAREQQQQGKAHPVAYPKSIPARCIEATTVSDALVLDPYMGGGTTLVAAKELRRRAIGIEIDERYCELAAKQLAQGVLF